MREHIFYYVDTLIEKSLLLGKIMFFGQKNNLFLLEKYILSATKTKKKVFFTKIIFFVQKQRL